MRRLLLAAAVLLGAPAALSQAVTRPVVTFSAGAFENRGFYNADGDTTQNDTRIASVALRLGAEAPFVRFGAATVSAGGSLALSSFEFGGGPLRLQNLDLYGRIGTPRVSARAGVAVDLGQSAYEGQSYNTDGQSAAVAQLRAELPAGPVVVVARADAALTLPDEVELYGFGGPVGERTRVQIDGGNLYSAQAGAVVDVGPVRLGLAAFYTARGDASVSYTDTTPPGEPASSSGPGEYGHAYGLIPSVEVRPAGGHVLIRAEGAFGDYLLAEGVPLGITLGGENSVVVRRVGTLSLSVTP